MINRVKCFLKVDEDQRSVFPIIYIDVPIIGIVSKGCNYRVQTPKARLM